MKRSNPYIFISIFLLLVLTFSVMTIYAFGEKKNERTNVSAKSASLYLHETGEFLFSKNADVRMPMASTTKIMTALVAIESCSLSDMVKIDESAIGTEGSSAYLKSTDVLSMEELLYALLLQSANDAAVAIACYVGGDNEGFSNMMNKKAELLGLQNTHFTNPHGLDSKEHYTTAHDLAIITSCALDNPIFKTIVSTYKKTFSTENRSRTYVNHNRLLLSYDGCIGVKTGYTKKSGRCLVSAAERDGLTYVSVTLNAPDDWNDHKMMMDYGFEQMEKISFCQSFDHIYQVPVINGKCDNIIVHNPDGAEIIVKKGEHEIGEFVKLSRFVVAPIKEGDILGEIIYTLNGKEVTRAKLVAAEDAKTKYRFY